MINFLTRHKVKEITEEKQVYNKYIKYRSTNQESNTRKLSKGFK